MSDEDVMAQVRDDPRRALDTALRDRAGHLLAWMADPSEPPLLAGEGWLGLHAVRDGDPSAEVASLRAVVVGSLDGLTDVLLRLRGRRCLLVDLVSGVATPVGGDPFACLPSGRDLPTQGPWPHEVAAAMGLRQPVQFVADFARFAQARMDPQHVEIVMPLVAEAAQRIRAADAERGRPGEPVPAAPAVERGQDPGVQEVLDLLRRVNEFSQTAEGRARLDGLLAPLRETDREAPRDPLEQMDRLMAIVRQLREIGVDVGIQGQEEEEAEEAEDDGDADGPSALEESLSNLTVQQVQNYLGMAARDVPPAVLEVVAREILAALGGPSAVVAEAYGGGMTGPGDLYVRLGQTGDLQMPERVVPRLQDAVARLRARAGA